MAGGTVLVTGAAGGAQGQTGRHVSELLLAKGAKVRAFVRKLDERSERLRSLGADVVVGDFLDYRSVERAVAGVSSVYFAYPVQDGLLEATAIMADAARKAGVTRLIDMVMLVSSPDAPTPRMRENYLSERIFEWAGIGAAHVRATVFYENVRALTAATIARDGTIYLPWGSEQTIVPIVSAKDVARVAVGALTSPSVPPAQFLPGDRQRARPARHDRHLQARSRPGGALSGNSGQNVGRRSARARLQPALRRAPVETLAVDPHPDPPLRGDGYDCRAWRSKTQELRGVRARTVTRLHGAAGASQGGPRDEPPQVPANDAPAARAAAGVTVLSLQGTRASRQARRHHERADAMDHPSQRHPHQHRRAGQRPARPALPRLPGNLVFVAQPDRRARRGRFPCRRARYARLRQERSTGGHRPVHHLPSGRRPHRRARCARCPKRGRRRP